MRDLLEKLSTFAGEKVGQKPGDQWRGTDKAPPGKKLVGDSILRDLHKGPAPKTKEQELAEEFQAFLEAEFKDTVDRRPSRKSDRPRREYGKTGEHSKRYQYNEGKMKEVAIDLKELSDEEFQKKYGKTKQEMQLALSEGAGQEYTVVINRNDRERPVSGTIPELLDYFGYTLEVGKSYEHERGRYKINMNPKNVQQLVDALNKAASNGAANGAASTYYSVGSGQMTESHYKWVISFKDGKQAIYHQRSPHYSDATAASDIEYTLKSNRGSTLELATKDDLAFNWQEFLEEGWESGPDEYQEPYDDADDAYDRRRQEKLDAETEKEWAKRPQEKVYTLLGRGPNMEPNYEFPGEFKSLEDAIAAREKIMADPNTPHPEHIGIHSYTRYLDKTNEAVQGGGGIKNLEDYEAKRDHIYKNLADPKQADNYSHFRQALFDLNRLAKEQGIPIEESRAHKQLSTWFKNRELADKFAKGELTIPTPAERKAQLEKSKDKKPVKEYGATSTGSPTSANTQMNLSKPNDSVTAKKVAQATATLKSATQSGAPNTAIAKALDAASQGKPVNATDMKALEPMMDVIQKTGADPQLANQFKQLVQKVQQAKV